MPLTPAGSVNAATLALSWVVVSVAGRVPGHGRPKWVLKSSAADANRSQACPSAQPTHADVCEPKTARTGELVESFQPAPQSDGTCSPAGYIATPPLPSAPYWALDDQPRGASNRMSPWLSV